MLYFNTNTPHSFFFFFLQNTSCVRKPRVISGGVAHPLHPPPRSVPDKSIEGIPKGYLFCQKWYIKGLGVGPLRAEPPRIKTLLSTPPEVAGRLEEGKKLWVNFPRFPAYRYLPLNHDSFCFARRKASLLARENV